MKKAGMASLGDGSHIAWRLDGPENCDTLVFSNSLGTTMSMWDEIVDAISHQVRILRYDMRGHGASTVTPGDYGLDRLGRDLTDLMDRLNIERAHFCGVSLGGMIGQWLGVFAPNRVDRLVLANTSAFMGPAEVWQARMNLIREQGIDTIVDAVTSRWFTQNFVAYKPQQFDRLRSELLSTSPQGYAGCCGAIRDMDMRPLSHLIQAPTLVIAGIVDPATPPAMAQALAKSIVGSEFALLDAAHLSNVECGELFAEALMKFIRSDT